MGRILVYLVVGYVALIVFMSVLTAAPWLLFLLIALIVVFFRRNESRPRYAGELPGLLALPWNRRELESAPRPGEAERAIGRLRGAAERLAAEFPENRLENPALVAVLALYAHEPQEERDRLEHEFDSWQGRFLAWRQRLQELHGFPPQAELTPLADEQAALETYVAELRGRAAEADELPQRALDEVTRAGALITTAREAWKRLPDAADVSALAEQLDVAAAGHADAWAAVGGDAPRPLTALRLAGEAAKLAEAVQQEASRLAGLPEGVRRRLQELAPSIAQMRDGLDLVEAEVRSAASAYAVSSWREISGVGSAAREAVERAARLHEAAAEDACSEDPARLDRAARSLDEVAAALEDAERLRAAIQAHLQKLEAAALEARERVVAAEKEVDQAWSATQALGEGQRLERAAELVRQARAGLGSAQPDWLAIVELADRAAELARGAGSGLAEPELPADALHRTLAEVKVRAADARETALAWALVAPATADMEHALLEEANRLYSEALEAEGAPATVERAIAAYSAAEEAAQAFAARVQARRGPKGDRQDAPPPLGHALVWDLAIRFSTRG